MKRTRFLAIFLILALLLAACGAGRATEMGAVYDRAESMEAPAEKLEELGSSTTAANTLIQDNRKLIKTVRLDAETEHYDDLISALDAKVAALGGYVESRQSGSYARSRRWCSMTVRIPAENLDSFVAHVTENANVTAASETTEDLTLQYVDTEAKITALETEQTRLLELLSQAQNLSEILEIEARLSDVTYELERYTSQLRGYDNLVTYATVELSIDEVAVLTPTEELSVWHRIRTGFAESLSDLGTGLTDLFVWIVVNSPYLLILGAVCVGITFLFRKKRRKARKIQQPPASDTP